MTATWKSGCAAGAAASSALPPASSVRPNTPEPIQSVAATIDDDGEDAAVHHDLLSEVGSGTRKLDGALQERADDGEDLGDLALRIEIGGDARGGRKGRRRAWR